MTPRFVGDPEIVAGSAPLGSVRLDASAARAGVRQQVRKFMSQGAIDLRGAVFTKLGIQRHGKPPPVCPSRGSLKPRLPTRDNRVR
jgi:hypothetical protein